MRFFIRDIGCTCGMKYDRSSTISGLKRERTFKGFGERDVLDILRSADSSVKKLINVFI